MIDTEHTPGPWKLWQNDVGAFVISQGDAAILCQRNDWDHRAAESSANARLISAAPDMLEALMEFVSMFPTVPGSIGDEVRQKARAAIAKACGVPVEELGAR